jgi:hypothetical protein
MVAMTEFGVYLLVCNRYAKGISSGPLDRGGLNIAINRVFSSGNAVGDVFLAFEVTKFAALFDKFVSPRARRSLRRRAWSRARISTATMRSLLSAAAKIDLILPHSQSPVGGQSKGGARRAPTSTKERQIDFLASKKVSAAEILARENCIDKSQRGGIVSALAGFWALTL